LYSGDGLRHERRVPRALAHIHRPVVVRVDVDPAQSEVGRGAVGVSRAHSLDPARVAYGVDAPTIGRIGFRGVGEEQLQGGFLHTRSDVAEVELQVHDRARVRV